MVIQRSGLIPHYQTEKEGQERIENLNELVNAAAAFVAEEGYTQDAPAAQASAADSAAQLPSPLAAFLSHASLEAGDNQAEAGQDALQLMTVHSAKGLEFHAVFITGLEEGLFPHENSLHRAGRTGGGAAPDVRRDHPRAPAGFTSALRRAACCTGRRATA